MGDHPTISDAQNRFLEGIPTLDEVKRVVWACSMDKAPGFDGFNFRFIREMWDVMQHEFYAFVLDFFNNGGSLRHINVTWVTLIPKVATQFRLMTFDLLVWSGRYIKYYRSFSRHALRRSWPAL